MRGSARIFVVPTVELFLVGVTFFESLVFLSGPFDLFLAFVAIVDIVEFFAVTTLVVFFRAFDDDFVFGRRDGLFGFDRSIDFFIVSISDGIRDFLGTIFALLVDLGSAFAHGVIIDGFDGVFDRLFDFFVLGDSGICL